jgi:hypothetical protein
MQSFKSFSEKYSRDDLNPSFRGKSSDHLNAIIKNNRKHPPHVRKAAEKELQMRSQVKEEAGSGPLAGAPGNNTRSGPGMGDDTSLKMKKARAFKKIWRRHKLPGVKEEYSKAKYYLQPDGTWKKGGDGRSPGKTKAELEAMGKGSKIRESAAQLKKAGVSKYNSPKASAKGDKSHVVVAKDGDKTKLIRFGQKGVKGSPDGSARNKAIKARHAKNIAKGKMSAGYWANKTKW